MTLNSSTIAQAIDEAPFNRGVRGADWLASGENTAVTFDNGDIALFEGEGDGNYSVHFLFIGRGRKAIDHAREAFKVMFTAHGAKLIFGLVPAFRRDVRLLARWAGGKCAGIRETADGPCVLYVLSKSMWEGSK
mgnify:CR=1 FL=1